MTAFILILFAAAMRFVPFLPFAKGVMLFNFAPVGASLLYFGARQERRLMWAPMALFLTTDIVLNLYIYHVPLTLSAYGSVLYYGIALLMGGLLKEKTTALRVLGLSVTGSFAFFFVSNILVWMEGRLYPLTAGGLATCFTLALPFFQPTLMGDLVYSSLFFGVPALVTLWKEQASVAGAGNGPRAV